MRNSLILGVLLALGCGGANTVAVKPTAPGTSEPPATATATDDVALERAKLSPEDLALVTAQEWCVVNTDERLGSMGAPIKLALDGQPVFLCCKGCKRKAEADPAKTLAALAELKAKARKAKP